MRVTLPDDGGARSSCGGGLPSAVTLSPMRGALDDEDVAWGSSRRGGTGREHGSASPVRRYGGLVAGFVLAVAATLAVLLTDNPQYLRLAVLAAAWAFVI